MRGLWIAIGVLAALLVAAVVWTLSRQPERVTVRASTVVLVRTAAPAEPDPRAGAGATATATATATVRVAPERGPWAEHTGDLPFVVGAAAGLAKAQAEGRMAFLFYTQHG